MKTILQIFEKLKDLPKAKTIIINQESDLTKLIPPYYMKIDSSEHKLKKQGVIKIQSLNQAKQEYNLMKKKFKEKIIIQELIKGTEMVIGLKYDDVFEKILMIGLGGSEIEKQKDVQFRATPLTKQEIKNALKELKNYPRIKNLAIDKFCELALKISKMNFQELDLNPIIIDKNKVTIIDARGN